MKSFDKLDNERLEYILYIPTRQERKLILEILLNRNEARIERLENNLSSLEERDLTNFGKFCIKSDKEDLEECLKKRKEISAELAKLNK